MTSRHDTLRATLGRVGIWSFGLQANRAADAQAGIATYEGLGYTATWFPESIGSKEALSHAALLLAGGPRMVIATGIANIYARDAAAMMSGARTLAEAYPGRFVLGIGVSHAPSVAARGGTYGRPIETMAAYLDAMDAAAWSGPCAPGPAARAPRRAGPADAGAGRGARGRRPPLFRAGGAHPIRARAAGPGPVLAVEVTAVLDTDPGRARETARAFATRYLALPNYANNLRRLGWSDEDLAGGGSDRLLDAVVVQGDAAAIAGRVREHLDAGADHVCVQVRSANAADLCLEAYAELRDALGEALRHP